MFIAAQLGESWVDLAARLDARDTMLGWSAQEPELGELTTVAALADALAPDADPSRWDAIFGSVLRIAAQHGGDDPDAVLVVLHLVDAAADRLRRRFDADLILGALTVQIRAFPWRTRTRAYAANLLFDTEKSLCAETRPRSTRSSRGPDRIRRDEDRPIDPTIRDGKTGLSALDRPVDGPEAAALDLIDVLLWAKRTGIASARDLSMLVEYFYARDAGGGHAEVARTFGVSVRTSKGRCAAALRALRAAAQDYLAA